MAGESESQPPPSKAQQGFERPAGRRILLTGIWNTIGQIVTFVSQVGLVPLYLKSWGTERYGDWLTVSALVAYISLADLGMQQYVTNRIAKESSQGRFEDARATLSSAVAMYVGLTVLASAGLFAVAFTYGHGWPSDGNRLSDGRMVFLLLGGQAITGILSGLALGLYRTIGLTEVGQMQVVIQRALQLVLTAAVLMLHAPPVVLAATQAMLAAAVLAAAVLDLGRRNERLRPRWSAVSAGLAVSFILPSLGFLLVSLAQGLSIQGTILVLSAQLGPSAVVAFTTTRTLANVVRQISGLFASAVWPEMTRLDAIGDRGRMELAHRLLVKLSVAVTLPAIAWLCICGTDIYAAWTRGQMQVDRTLLLALLLDQALSTPWLASSFVLAATNRLKGVTLLYVLQGVGWVGLSWIAAPRLGVASVGLVGLGLNACLFSVFVPLWAQQATGNGLEEYLRGIYLPAAVLLLFSVGCAAVIYRSMAASVPAIGITLVGVYILSLFPIIRSLLGKDDWARLMSIGMASLKWRARSGAPHA